MHPILVYLWNNFYIGTYGVMVATGALLGLLLAIYRARHTDISSSFIIDLLFYSALVGFIGARIVFILVNFEDFLRQPAVYIFSRQGFVFLGGILFALPVAIWYTRKHHMPVGAIADILAPSLPLAHALGRLGCFAAGCCFGKVAEGGFWSAIAMRFPAVLDKQGELIGSFVYIEHLQRGWIPPTAEYSLPVIPTQLIESGANILILIALLLVSRRKMPPGRLFVLYIILYSVMRFFVEYLRDDVERGVWFGIISTSQILTLLMLTGSIIYILCDTRKRRRTA